MKISFENYASIDLIDTNTFVLFVSEEYITNYIDIYGISNDNKKSAIQLAIKDYDFKGKCGDIVIVGSDFGNCDKIILVGIGKEAEFTINIAEEIGYKTIKYLRTNKIKNATCLFNTKVSSDGLIEYSDSGFKNNFNNLYSHLIFGFNLGSYTFNRYFTEDKLKGKTLKLENVIFLTNNIETLQNNFNELDIVRDNVFFCRDLINEPANVIYPESLVKIAKELTKLGVEVEVLKEKDMEKLGMGSLLAVGQGSDNDSYMVVLKWNGGNKEDKPLAFVGKGVTFDSGGLSLKPSSAMDDMKTDMSGSAVVLSLIRLLAMRKAKVNVIGVMALVENMPSGKAIKIGDIIKSMSGQTIEILNTDAEGRMILADALYYTATMFKPQLMIDLATLTGAICVALGEKYAGMFSNNDELSKELIDAGNNTGETLWRMPLSKLGGFYDKQIDSEFADVRNTGKTREGGSITAAQFLQRFINKMNKWAHIDIAATAYVKQDGFLTTKNATGYGVRLLNELIKNNYEK